MIVNINKQNREQYEDLFARVSRVLTGLKSSTTFTDTEDDGAKYELSDNTELSQYLNEIPEEDKSYLIGDDGNIQINSLVEYFSFLKFLGQLHPRFIRLPLDESLFTINLNRRLITVPSGNNVYAVTNDDRAETIYFKCARYFDTVDLGSEDMNIIIQSRCINSSGKEINRIFKAQQVDIDSDPNYIIFGWIIPKEITQKDGSVTISIRFYQLNDDETKIIYSLGTQPTTIQVLRSFNFSIDDVKNDNIIFTQPFLNNFAIKGTDSITQPVLAYTGDSDTDSLENLNNLITFKIEPTDIAGGEEVIYTWQYIDPYENSDPVAIPQYNYSEISIEDNEEFSQKLGELYVQTASGGYDLASTYDAEDTYYLRENNNSTSLSTKKGGTYNCRVEVKKNRYTKSGITANKTIIWPAKIKFNVPEEDSYFDILLISKYDTDNSKHILQENILNKFQSYIGKTNTNDTIGYLNNENIDISLSANNISFASEQDKCEMTLTATNGPLNELEQKCTSEDTVTILKPIKINTATVNSGSAGEPLRYYTINQTSNGIYGAFYDNIAHDINKNYENALSITIVATPPSGLGLEELTFTSFSEFNDSEDFTSGVTYDYSLTIKDKDNNQLYSSNNS